MPGRWIVAQEGTRQSYAVPIAFNRLGKLRMFYVDIWCRWGKSSSTRAGRSPGLGHAF